MKWTSLLIVLLASPAFGGSIQLTIPDSKDAKVIAAKDLYNARNGTSLTIQQWVKVVVRRAVVEELSTARAEVDQAAVDAAKAALQGAEETAAGNFVDSRTTENEGWE